MQIHYNCSSSTHTVLLLTYFYLTFLPSLPLPLLLLHTTHYTHLYIYSIYVYTLLRENQSLKVSQTKQKKHKIGVLYISWIILAYIYRSK